MSRFHPGFALQCLPAGVTLTLFEVDAEAAPDAAATRVLSHGARIYETPVLAHGVAQAALAGLAHLSLDHPARSDRRPP